jgi:hypothetical protein
VVRSGSPCRSRVARAHRPRPSAPPRSPPPSSPARLRKCSGSIPCVTSFVPVLSPLKTASPSPRTARPPECRRSAAVAPPLAAGVPPLPRLR